MAVRKRTYHGYSGPLTDPRTRFLVLFRYSWSNFMRARFAIAYMVMCLLVAVVFGSIIYVSHSSILLGLFGAGPEAAAKFVSATFFYRFLQIELGMALLLTAFAGPGLISPDLANQALPLYFCRPFSRAEYVLGKFSVLAVLISLITWIPGLCLFALQGDLSGWSWCWSNLWIAGGIFFGSWVILLVYSALALALSAWFRRRAVAGGVLLGIFFIGSGLGQAFDAALRTNWGRLIDIGGLIRRVVASLFRLQPMASEGMPVGIPAVAAAAMLVVVCAFCLFLIERRIRAREVVRQ
jgi:ABC-2 type transport system permease protein